MSNKFLYPLHDESLSALTNGTATLYLKSLKVNDLQGSRNVSTDSAKYLKSDSGGGGGVVTTNKPVEENAIVVYDGTTGDNIKFISGLKYDDVNARVVVPDIESGAYLSLNSQLQLISNIQSATQSPDIVTNFNGEIHVAKIKSASHNTELEFETDGDAALTTDGNISFTAGATGDIGLNTYSLTITCPDNAIRLNNQSVKFVITRIMNTFSGIQAGANINTGDQNTAFGYNSLQSINSGNNNTAFGSQALKGNNTGSYNVAVGDRALTANTSGANNVAIGTQALFSDTGGDNTGVGHQVLYSNTTGYNNVGIGYQSLLNNLDGHNNTAVGWISGGDNVAGARNTFIGKSAGANNVNGTDNTFIGYESKGTIGQTFNNSTAIGAYSQISASNQIVLGNILVTETVPGSDGVQNLGASNKKFNNIYGTTYHENGYSGSLIKNFPVGSNNTFSFITTPPDLTSGDNNTFYGLYAGDNVEISDSSTCIGVNAMRNSANAVDRGNNTIVGKNAGQGTFASTFKGCTMIGMGAGSDQTTGDNNTLIGYNATTQSGNKTNSIAIGYEATVLNDNQCCIGNGSIEKIYNEGNGTCDLGAATRQFKDLYLAGNIYGSPYDFSFACTDEVNTITSTGQKMYMRAPRDFSVQKFKVSLNAVAGAGFALNIKKNGSNMISTITLGTTITTITPFTPVSVLEDDVITVDVTNIGSGTGVGLKVYLIGKT